MEEIEWLEMQEDQGEDVYLFENSELNPELTKQLLFLRIRKLADKMRTEGGSEPDPEELYSM